MPKTFYIAVAAAAAFLLTASGAFAVGFLTQMNCASDYYAYCSQFSVGTKELRLCMRRAGPKLSKSCLNALIADGEVSKAEVEKTKQEIAAARSGAKRTADAKQKDDAKQKEAAKQKDGAAKQKPLAVAKADTEASAPDEGKSHASDKKSAHKSETAKSEISKKPDKLALSPQTFAALKQRAPKFIEEAKADENFEQVEAEKRPRAAAEKAASQKPEASKKRERTTEKKRKAAKEGKATDKDVHKKPKAKSAGKKAKHPSAARKSQGASKQAAN